MEKRDPGPDGEDRRFCSLDWEHVATVGESGEHRSRRVLARTPSRFACCRVAERFSDPMQEPEDGADLWLKN